MTTAPTSSLFTKAAARVRTNRWQIHKEEIASSHFEAFRNKNTFAKNTAMSLWDYLYACAAPMCTHAWEKVCSVKSTAKICSCSHVNAVFGNAVLALQKMQTLELLSRLILTWSLEQHPKLHQEC